MAEASISINQEHFICSICLHTLNEPVTTPCGHTFCMQCLNVFWDTLGHKARRQTYSCPCCRETFSPRPVLRKSNVLTEIIEQLEATSQQTSLANALDIVSLEGQDVDCDICIDVKGKAVKSCLTCLASYCETHVQAHHGSPVLSKHVLVTAMSNLQQKTCAQHAKLLEVFCYNEKKVICQQCAMDKHRDHAKVPVGKEWMEKKKYFEDLQQKCQSRLESRKKTLQELKALNDAYKHSAQEAVEDCERIFSELLVPIKTLLTGLVKAQEQAQLTQTGVVQEQLEQEIANLEKKQTYLEKLSQTKGYVHFLQRFHFLSPRLEIVSPDPFKVTINPQWSFNTFKKSVVQLKEEVEAVCKEKFEEVSENGLTFDQIIFWPEPKTREEFQKYACELSLDPNTTNNYLELLNDNTHIKCGKFPQNYPDHPERFSYWQQVLCKQSLPLQSYWEVEVDGKDGVSVAVSYKGIGRKGNTKECRFGHNAQSWRLIRYPNKDYCFWHNDTKDEISGPVSNRIGVYLDLKAGTLSFYSVSDVMSLIHKVTTAFTQPLYAGFGVATGSFVKICLQASTAGNVAAAAECLKKN